MKTDSPPQTRQPSVWLKELVVNRYLGIGSSTEAVCLESLSPGLNLVWGPNGRGKSCTAKGAIALLWGQGEAYSDLWGTVQRGEDEELLKLQPGNRQFSTGLPDGAVRGLYYLALPELLTSNDEDLVEQIRSELYGHINLREAGEELLFTSSLPNKGVNEYKTWNVRQREFRRIQKEQRELRHQLDGVKRLREERRELEKELQWQKRLQALLKLRRLGREKEEVESREREFDKRIPLLHSDDANNLTTWIRQLQAANVGEQNATREHRNALAEKAALEFHGEAPDKAVFVEAQQYLQVLRKAEQTVDERGKQQQQEFRRQKATEKELCILRQEMENQDRGWEKIPDEAAIQRLAEQGRKLIELKEMNSELQRELAGLKSGREALECQISPPMNSEIFREWYAAGCRLPQVDGLLDAISATAASRRQQRFWEDKLRQHTDAAGLVNLDAARAAVPVLGAWLKHSPSGGSSAISGMAVGLAIVNSILILLLLVAGYHSFLVLPAFLSSSALAYLVWHWWRRSVSGGGKSSLAEQLPDETFAPSEWETEKVAGRLLEAQTVIALGEADQRQRVELAARLEEAQENCRRNREALEEKYRQVEAICGFAPDGQPESVALSGFLEQLKQLRRLSAEEKSGLAQLEAATLDWQEREERYRQGIGYFSGSVPESALKSEEELANMRQYCADRKELLRRLQQLQMKENSQKASIDEHQESIDSARQDICSSQTALGQRLEGWVDLGEATALQVEVAILNLQERNDALDKIRAVCRSTSEKKEHYHGRCEELRELIRQTLEERGFRSEQEFWEEESKTIAVLLDGRAAWQKMREHWQNLQGAEREVMRELDSPPSQAEEKMTADELVCRLQDQGALSKRKEALDKQITELELKARQAEENHSLEQAQMALDDALASLESRRRGACAAMAGAVLLDFLGDHNKNFASSILNRARILFANFTQGRYELQINDASLAPTFAARDTRCNQILGLEELSSGTRIQLLVASRLAFLEQKEEENRCCRPPLFLDEALANSDPERRQALMEILAELCRCGRQIFYFTAEPYDISQWRDFCRENGELDWVFHSLDKRATEIAPRIPLWRAPVIPEPVSGESLLEYGARLSVAPLVVGEPADSAHLWYIAGSPEQLYRCLRVVGSHCGALRQLLGGRTRARIMAQLKSGGEEIDGLERRLQILSSLLEQWNMGRAKALGETFAEIAPQVSGTFREKALELATIHASEPDLLLRKFAELPRVRGTTVEKLRNLLDRKGHLSKPEILIPEETILRNLRLAFNDHTDIDGIVERSALFARPNDGK